MGTVAMDRDNYMARLMGLSGDGMAAAGRQAGAGATYGNAMLNAIGSKADSTAAGYIGAGNALNDTMGNIYQRLGYANPYKGGYR